MSETTVSRNIQAPPSPPEEPAGAPPGAGLGAGTPVTFTIPIQVTISLGNPTLAVVPGAAIASAVAPPVVSREGLFGRTPTPPPVPYSKFTRESLAAGRFGWKTALSLALASRLAYDPASAVEATGRGVLGMQTCRFVEADDTQCFVASTADAVLLSFRGTENLGDWLGNLNMVQTTRPYGAVHRGFLGAFQVVEEELTRILTTFGDRPLLITGHSLGGALAMVAAAEWQGRLPTAWVYTYGQPAVGRGDFPGFMEEHYDGRIFRFVNDDDVVPRVPPFYQHVGKLIHFDAAGNLEGPAGALAERPAGVVVESMPSPPDPPMLSQREFDQIRAGLLQTRAATAAAGQESLGQPAVEGILPSVSDHAIDRYLAKILAKAGG
ncbi:lipase family protein [Aquisphaera insulae]|uniref:lipase family protein n=1 Tax=Aquisphaera insulae TaxID=2712864 RepID=UPI0013ED91C5|nr:lipase family protein [Aquisphaera insulae]